MKLGWYYSPLRKEYIELKLGESFKDPTIWFYIAPDLRVKNTSDMLDEIDLKIIKIQLCGV